MTRESDGVRCSYSPGAQRSGKPISALVADVFIADVVNDIFVFTKSTLKGREQRTIRDY